MVGRCAAFTFVLGLGIASLVDASSVGAQPYYYRVPYGAPYYAPHYYGAPRFAIDGLPLNQIMRAVRIAGYVPISAPVRRGPNYVVIADAPGRGPVRVAINAYEGEIISVTSATVRPDGGPRVAQDFVPPRNGAVVRAPEAGYPDGGEPQGYSRPNASPRNVPREGSNGRLANVPPANTSSQNVPTTGSTGSTASRVPTPRPRPAGTAPNDNAPGEALVTQGPAPSAGSGIPMVLPLPAKSSSAGNSQSPKPVTTRPETPKTETTKTETTLVPVAPLE